MNFIAEKDPRDLKGKKVSEIFDDYFLVKSPNIKTHIDTIKVIIGNTDAKLYSLPDAAGMRFMRQMADGSWLSDFRFERI